MDHWTDLPSEDHWKSVSFIAIYTSCCLVFWARCTHQVFGSLNTLLSCGFQDSPPDYSIIFQWNIKKRKSIFLVQELYCLSLECMEQTTFTLNPKRELEKKTGKIRGEATCSELLCFSQNREVQVLWREQRMSFGFHTEVYSSKISSSIFK